MPSKKKHILFTLVLFTLLLTGLVSCNNSSPAPAETVIVDVPEQFEEKFPDHLKEALLFIGDHDGKLNDSVILRQKALVERVYEANSYQPVWSKQQQWLPIADSLDEMIARAKYYGLFPSDYHYTSLKHIRKEMDQDSVASKNVALWTKADMMYTDAWLQMAMDLKLGHLSRDSVTLRKDSLLDADFFYNAFREAIASARIQEKLHQMEPALYGYQQLKAALPSFLDSVKFKNITYLFYPYKDSIKFYRQLELRLAELGYLKSNQLPADTTAFRTAVRAYQQAKGMKTSGKVSETMVRALNSSDWEKFKRIAVNMDRYRLIGDTLPQTYWWVNLPSYTLSVYDADTLAFQSKVIVGTPRTRTPLLNSEVVNFVTYPQWTVPYSIIFKEMLPKIQQNTNYLNKQNLMVVDKNDSVIHPSAIDWSKLNKKYFPYLLKQRQGDDNSLGIMKFNFRNKYSVYLHDTNARWLFNKSSRALSHGCVRVQEWEKLSRFLVRNDTLRYPSDTLKAWIVRQEKHVVSDFPRVPLFIRYFTCEGRQGRVKFFEDIYAEDRILAERYFATKPIQ